ncbi:MAG: succinate dehydrogenase/fumarate reductase iron-sulfur subunit [Myxococcota bacterium]
MKLVVRIWRQKDASSSGKLEAYETPDFSAHASFLEMLDILNETLIDDGKDPVAFDHDCREGICGACSLVINGVPHGPMEKTTVCQLHLRHFKDGDTVTIEPWRAEAFPVIKDLVVDRSALDRIQQAGGFISINTGGTPDANAIPIARDEAETSMDAAQCIGCGACVATCKNASAMLFVAAKVAQFAHLPQGRAERTQRVLGMVAKMDAERFGNCTNTYDCEAVCPKGIPVRFIAEMNRDYFRAAIVG